MYWYVEKSSIPHRLAYTPIAKYYKISDIHKYSMKFAKPLNSI